MTSNLKQQLFSGVFYTALAKYSGIIISLVVAGVLARLLSPDDFGIVAIATVIIAFFSIFTDMGISPAIIQDKTLTEHELSDIFSFTLWMGIGYQYSSLPPRGPLLPIMTAQSCASYANCSVSTSFLPLPT